ncbi:Panacea domain-containing protein [Rhizobium ruizarguesonis]
MLIPRDREKLINAMNFFLSNTKKCGKVKLFKLLYFMDFEHFKQTGRSVTGLDYFAWPMGPVPVDLYGEMDAPEQDLAESFRFEERPIRNGEQTMLVMTPQTEFSDEHFSKREMRIMRELAGQYVNSPADEMIEATHLENQPWHKVYVQDGRKQAIIPYILSVSGEDATLLEGLSSERAELQRALR